MKKVTAGSARIGPVCGLPALLRQFRVDPIRVLSQAGVDPAAFDDPDNVIAYRDFCRLLAACVAATGCAEFGLLLGQQVSISALGAVGALARSAPDMATALRDFETYLHLFDRAGTLLFAVDDDNAMFSFAIAEPGLVATDQMYDLCISVAFNAVRALCGPGFRPTSVALPHRPPPDRRAFTRFFGIAPVFDGDQAEIAFPAAWLARPVHRSDAAQREAHLRAVAAIDATTSTLRRQLGREGRSFRQIAAEVRYEAARHFLLHSEVPLDRLSAVLGYSEHSAFTRAFRAWAGLPPGAWQARERLRFGLDSAPAPQSGPPPVASTGDPR